MSDFRDYDSPYQPPAGREPARGGGSGAYKWVLVILALLGVGGVLGLAVCCGLPAFFFYLGKSMIESSTLAKVEEHPLVKEHLGEVRSVTINLVETGNIGRDGVFALDAVGSKGKALLISETLDGNPAVVTSVLMRLRDGREFDLLE